MEQEDATRLAKLAEALKNGDSMAVMDVATPDEAARAFGQPSEKEAEATGDGQEATIDLAALSSVGLGVTLNVSISEQTLTMTENGQTYEAIAISSARPPYHTKRGLFHNPRLEKMHRSQEYGGSPMPHSEFYYGGYAVHGTYEISHLGRPASHGCVRVHPDNATILYSAMQKSEQHGYPSIIYVHD